MGPVREPVAQRGPGEMTQAGEAASRHGGREPTLGSTLSVVLSGGSASPILEQ
jgi:hypothetical protein